MTITTQTKAAKEAGVHVITVRRMLKAGKIKGYKIKNVKTDQVCLEEVLETLSGKMKPEEKIKQTKQNIGKNIEKIEEKIEQIKDIINE